MTQDEQSTVETPEPEKKRYLTREELDAREVERWNRWIKLGYIKLPKEVQ
jgi:hypothetical protein